MLEKHRLLLPPPGSHGWPPVPAPRWAGCFPESPLGRAGGRILFFLLSILPHVLDLAATQPLPLVFSRLDPLGCTFDLASFWKSLEFSPGWEKGSPKGSSGTPCLALWLRGQCPHCSGSPPKHCKFLQSRDPISFPPARPGHAVGPASICRVDA